MRNNHVIYVRMGAKALFFFLMIRRPPGSTQSRSSAASDVYKRQKLTYESHYNKRLNKCFMLVTYSKSQLKSLKEISENKMYGSLLVKQNSKTLICNVLENKCKTEKEWDALVKPYMEE